MRFARPQRLVWCTAILTAITAASGCAVIHQMMNGDGPMMPAMFDGLEGKRVAVVCMMNSSSYGAESTAADIAMRTSSALRRNVEEIEVVRYEDVADWIDNNNWDESDYVEVGNGVKSDLVIAFEIDSFSLHDGPTLYKGQAYYTIKVYDVKNGGELVFDYTQPDYAFPQSHGIPSTDKKESEFRRLFVEQLAMDMSRTFYSYRMVEDFAKDAAAYAH